MLDRSCPIVRTIRTPMSSAKVRMQRNDCARESSYDPHMARKATPPREIGPDWFLHEWMKSKEMKQAELAKRTGWSKATVNDIYHGRTEYYRAILNKVAGALEIYPWELLMSPAEANRIKRWRAAFENEQQVRAAEERREFKGPQPEDDPGRLLPRKSG